jgi:hypothetical protein
LTRLAGKGSVSASACFAIANPSGTGPAAGVFRRVKLKSMTDDRLMLTLFIASGIVAVTALIMLSLSFLH